MYSTWDAAHRSAMLSLGIGELQRLCFVVSTGIGGTSHTYAPILDFLASAGKDQTVAQCKQVDTEMSCSAASTSMNA